MLFLLGPMPKSANDLFVPDELEGLWEKLLSVTCVFLEARTYWRTFWF